MNPFTFDAALEASARGFEQLRYGYEHSHGFHQLAPLSATPYQALSLNFILTG